MTGEETKRVGYARKVARNVLKEFYGKKSPIVLPVPVNEIAESHGIEIFYLDNLEKHHRAIKQVVPDENRVLVGVNNTYHVHNQRFSIGHELGHHFLSHLPESECSEEEIKICNLEADEFSAELLMPLTELKRLITEVKDTEKIANSFKVSKEALFRKINSHGLLKHL